MKLAVVAKSRVSHWKVVAAVVERPDQFTCPFVEALDDFMDDPKRQAWVAGLEAIWDRIPFNGPSQLGTSMYHMVDEANGIFEFRKGRLRVLCFQVQGSVCVCSTVFLKASDKTPAAQVTRAVKLKKSVAEAMNQGEIEYVEARSQL